MRYRPATTQGKPHPLTRRSFMGAVAASAATWMAPRAALHAAAAPRARAIDVHAHFYPESYLRSFAEKGGAQNFSAEVNGPNAFTLISNGGRLQLDETFWNLDKRLARLQASGITTQILSLSQPMTHLVAPERGAELARLFNDAVIEAHKRYPTTYYGCATLPLQAMPLALKELERIGGEQAIKGIYLPTSLPWGELSDASMHPLYERCQEMRLPILLHPLTVIGVERLRSFYFANLLGNPYDTGVAASYLCFSGTMDKFPKLSFVLPHVGGTFPFLAGRLAHGQEVRAENKSQMKYPLRDYLKERFYYDSITHSSQILGFLIKEVGVERIMVGSDYTFDMGPAMPTQAVLEQKLSAADENKILYGNAAKLLRI